MQQERQGGSPNLFHGCKSLGSYESEWVKPEPRSPKMIKEHKHRGGQSNHGTMVPPGQDLNDIPVRHPTNPGRRRSYSAQH